MSTKVNAATQLQGTVPVADLPLLVGDSGSGGTAGLAPAPGAGDAAANKFLKASGAWAVTPAAPVSSVFTRTGAVVATSGDYTAAQVTGAASQSGVQQETYVYGADSGTANTYAVTLSPAPSLVAGSTVTVKIAHTNTGASTLNVNSGGAVAIQKNGGLALVGGELQAGGIYEFVYDGTQFQMKGFASQVGAIPYDVISGLPGKPGASAIVCLMTFTRTVVFAGNFAGSAGTVGTNPTSTATYTVKKNGSSIGTVVVSTGGAVTFTTTAGATETFNSGDRLEVDAPGSQDATLSDVAFTLSGTR